MPLQIAPALCPALQLADHTICCTCSSQRTCTMHAMQPPAHIRVMAALQLCKDACPASYPLSRMCTNSRAAPECAYTQAAPEGTHTPCCSRVYNPHALLHQAHTMLPCSRMRCIPITAASLSLWKDMTPVVTAVAPLCVYSKAHAILSVHTARAFD